MEKQKELVKNTLIIAVGKLSTQFLTFLLLPLYTAFLSPQEYGSFDLVMVYIALLAPIFTVQMEMSVFRYLIDARNKQGQISKIISSSFFITLLGALSGAIAIGSFGLLFSISLAPYIIYSFISTVFMSYFLQVARGLGRNDVFAVASIISGLLNIILSVITVTVLNLSVSGILLSLSIANIMVSIILVIKTDSYKLARLTHVSKAVIRSLIDYAWPLVPNHISLWGISGVSRTIVAWVLGLASMGVYAAASKFTIIYTSLYSVFSMSWTESVSLHINKKGTFLSNASNSAIKLFGSLALGIVSASAIIFPLLVNGDFSQARNYIPILVIGGFFASLVNHYAAIYLAVKKTSKLAIVSFQALIVSTIMTIVGIWFIGLYAPSIAIVVTYLYLAIRRHFDIQQYVSIRYRKKMVLGLVIFAAIVLGLYYVNNLITDIISIVVTIGTGLLLNRNEISKIISVVLMRKI